MDYEMAQHPIGYVARRTGLSTHVIRAWERRYNAVAPERKGTKRRLYSEADIDRLKLLHRLSEDGLAIGQIANRTTDELKRMLVGLSDSTPKTSVQSDSETAQTEDISAIMRDCQSSIEALDATALDAAFMRGRVAFSEQTMVTEIVAPLMTWVGERWREGKMRSGQEHLATAVTKSFLNQIRRSNSGNADAPIIVVCTPAGELHEIGALMVATLAALEGWNDIYLGPNLPASDLANFASRRNAAMIALSIAAPGDGPRLRSELKDLREMVADDTIIVVGGEGAKRHREFLEENRMRVVIGMDEFRKLLHHSRLTADIKE